MRKLGLSLIDAAKFHGISVPDMSSVYAGRMSLAEAVLEGRKK
jgi:hypothetical protein